MPFDTADGNANEAVVDSALIDGCDEGEEGLKGTQIEESVLVVVIDDDQRRASCFCLIWFLGRWLVFCGWDSCEHGGMFPQCGGIDAGAAACLLTFPTHPEIVCFYCAFFMASSCAL